ncbi:MAG: uroporphyrinogen-III synthase [Actinomycetia bacterium]|nr:uroporphyrinogen-III synthase [Actinomycetes bacterium]
MDTSLPLAGWRVGVTADRRADAQLDLLHRRGADVLHGCTMRTIDLTGDERLFEVTSRIVARPPDTLVLETGMGLTMWLDSMDEVGLGNDLRSTLAGVEVVARGPKAVSAARRAGLQVAWSAPDEQFAEVVQHLADTGGRRRIALQLDGTDEEALIDPLAALCEEVVAIPVYRWALPRDTGPAEKLVAAICAGEVEAVTFTTQRAAVHLVEIAAALGRGDEVVAAFGDQGVVAVSVGPVCSAAVRDLGMSNLVEPERARLVAMVDALADHAVAAGSAA